MNELLVTIRLIAELGQAAEKIASIMNSENRSLSNEEIQAIAARVDASTSDWKQELERLREDR